MRIGLHYCRQAKIKGVDYLNYFDILVIISMLFIGGIERNPGPLSDSSTSSSDTITTSEEKIIKDKFSIVHYNVQSLLNKLDLIETELRHFDVICITETWLDQRIHDSDVTLKGYNLYRRDRPGDNHGGVCVYVRDNIYSCRRKTIELPNIECVWIELIVQGRKQLIGTFYRPPNSSNAVMSSIEDSVGQAFDTNIQNILITGDFNLDILKDNSNRKILNLCQQFNLKQLINDPTNFTENSSSIIDIFLTANNNTVISGVGEPFLEQNVRYHCPIYCVLNFNKTKTPIYTRNIYLYNRANYDDFKDEILRTDWDSLKDDDVDIYATNFTDKILELTNKHVPNKTIKVRQSDPTWLTNDIKRLIRKKKRLYNKFKQTKSTNDFDKYKRTRNKLTNAIRKSKIDEVKQIATKLENPNIGPKDWWRTLKTVIQPEQKTGIPPILHEDTIYSTEQQKAEILNKHFTNQTILNERNATIPSTHISPPFHLDRIFTSPTEIESTLLALKTGKAAGPDAVNNIILKELAQPLSSPMSDLFNHSLASGKVPALWKQANVTPIFKKDNPSDVTNYRPISLLSTIGKVLEKVIHKHLYNYFHENRVLTSLQSGFVPGDSTVNQLADLYNTFCKALDDGKEVRAVFCDISKAFDRVWHVGLIYKLKVAGVSGSLLDWFSDYLSNRKQRVVLPGGKSEWSYIRAGVPQGSILGPLLFLLYINDIVEDIHSSIRLFADDTSLYIIVDNPNQATNQLNSDLEKIHKWAKKWLVTFNPTKSESIIFSRKRHKPYHPPVLMDNIQINEVSSHKHLGLVFSNDCSWHNHLELIKSKAWTRVNVMRKLKFKLDRRSLETIYVSFIRPLLEYADIVWDNCTQADANELEKIQYEAARIVTGATKLVSIDSLLTDTGWETLSARRKKHRLHLFFKMVNVLTPEYLSSLVPPTVGSLTPYPLRNGTDIQTIASSSQLYYNSFLPTAIRDWNELPEEIRNSTTISTFKRKLNLNIEKPPKYYTAGTRIGQIYHARLRTSCSALNQHLFSKSIINSPSCNCGAIEDTQHFLFSCNLHAAHRRDLFQTISNIQRPSLQLLLYGNPELSNNQNKTIFIAVQEFLIKTKRFAIN